MVMISASLWSADLANLSSEIKKIDPYIDSYHFDVGDGVYIYNLLFFPDILNSLRKYTKKPFEVHLMVSSPEKYLESFLKSADLISFHPETSNSSKRFIKKMKRKKVRVGIIVRIEDKINEYEDLLMMIDKVTLMGTKIGVKGKEFDERVLKKIEWLREFFIKNKKDVQIEVDGGIRDYSVPEIAKAGADFVVAGSLIFNKKYKQRSKWMHSL